MLHTLYSGTETAPAGRRGCGNSCCAFYACAAAPPWKRRPW